LRKGFIQAGKFLAFLAVGILLLWLAFRTVEFKELGNSLKGANYSWLLLSMLFGILAYISRARRWMILINPLGYHPKFWSTFHSMMSGYLANLALPRIGEITRCVALGKKEKIPVDQLVGTVVIERTIDLISLLVILFGLFLTSGSLIRQGKFPRMNPFSCSGHRMSMPRQPSGIMQNCWRKAVTRKWPMSCGLMQNRW